MNKFANTLFQSDKGFKQAIALIANRQFKRRQSAYSAVALFDSEDLVPQLWARIFASDIADKDALVGFAQDRAEDIADKGKHRHGIYREIPISQLPKEERHQMENLFYSSYADDRDFD